jgi:hypothetical protein
MAVEDAVKVEPVGEFELKGIRRPIAAYDAAPQGFDAAKKVTGRRLRTSRAPSIGLSGLRCRNRRRQTKVVRLIVELAQDQRTADAAKSPCDFRATIGKK